MIHNVHILPITTYADDRGYFRELYRSDTLRGIKVAQTSVTMTYPGVIKAFHWHTKQDDLWYIASGMARVVLYDRRLSSSTRGQTQAIVTGEDAPVLIHIPKGVAHGYQVLGRKPVLLVYHVTQCYNPKNPDEGRIPFDDPSIGFDWRVLNR